MLIQQKMAEEPYLKMATRKLPPKPDPWPLAKRFTPKAG